MEAKVCTAFSWAHQPLPMPYHPMLAASWLRHSDVVMLLLGMQYTGHQLLTCGPQEEFWPFVDEAAIAKQCSCAGASRLLLMWPEVFTTCTPSAYYILISSTICKATRLGYTSADAV